MSAAMLYRLGGLSAVVGGLLMALDVVLHLFVDDTLTPKVLGGMTHEVWHVPGVVALPLVLMGLFAIYIRQSEEAGTIGLSGFVLLVFGMTIGAVYSTVFHGIFLPAIENVEGGLFETLVENTTAAQFYRGVVVQALGLGLGAILFGAATIRARVFPGLAGWTFIAAALFAAANEVWSGGQLVSRALFASAFVWMGTALRNRTATTRSEQTT